jgi:flagellin-like hook-associated protein FlgL
MDSLLQSMSTQSGTALASHANQMPGNVLSLLQTAN